MFDRMRMRKPRQRQPLDLSPTQLLHLWTQLLTAYAYYSDNQFAGHAQTAEILDPYEIMRWTARRAITAAIRRDWAAARRRLNEAVDRRR